MPYRPNYPATVAEVLGDVRYKPATIAAVQAFARAKPWRGTLSERIEKFRTLHAELCRIYGKQTRLLVRIGDEQVAGNGFYDPADDVIGLVGKLSVVTYLHEFGHALGKDERQTCRWSINLFRRCFPRSFTSAQHAGHMLVRQESRS